MGISALNQQGKKTMTQWAAMLVWCTIFVPAMVTADTYRCVLKDGTLSFSDTPCGDNAETVAHEISIDQWIAQSRPYRQPHPDPNRISKDLRSHSKMICDHIVSGAPYKRQDIYVSNKDRKIWKVSMYYKTADFHPWRIEMIYTQNTEGRDNLLWLTSISVFKWEKPFTPFAMHHITRLRQTGPGIWRSPER